MSVLLLLLLQFNSLVVHLPLSLALLLALALALPLLPLVLHVQRVMVPELLPQFVPLLSLQRPFEHRAALLPVAREPKRRDVSVLLVRQGQRVLVGHVDWGTDFEQPTELGGAVGGVNLCYVGAELSREKLRNYALLEMAGLPYLRRVRLVLYVVLLRMVVVGGGEDKDMAQSSTKNNSDFL